MFEMPLPIGQSCTHIGQVRPQALLPHQQRFIIKIVQTDRLSWTPATLDVRTQREDVWGNLGSTVLEDLQHFLSHCKIDSLKKGGWQVGHLFLRLFVRDLNPSGLARFDQLGRHRLRKITHFVQHQIKGIT